MQVQQLSDGVWYFTVATTPHTKVGYSWSRMVGGRRVETFASTSSDALMFGADTTLQKVTVTGGFTGRAGFLAWACTQLGGAGLTWWEFAADVEEGSYSCGTTSLGKDE